MTRACAGRPRLDRRGRRGGEQRRAVRSRRALCFLLPLREPHPLVLPPPPLVLFVERAGSRKRPRPTPPPPPSIGPSRSIARRAADRRRSTTRAIATTSMGTISTTTCTGRITTPPRIANVPSVSSSSGGGVMLLPPSAGGRTGGGMNGTSGTTRLLGGTLRQRRGRMPYAASPVPWGGGRDSVVPQCHRVVFVLVVRCRRLVRC